MIRLHETVRVARSAADCYRYIADFSTCEQWDPGVYRALKTTPGAPIIGSAFAVTVHMFGRRVTLAYTITHLTPGRRIELRGEGAGVTTHEIITFAADDHGVTIIDYRADFELGATLRATRPLVAPLLRRMGRRAVAGLKDALEIKSVAPAQGWFSYAADHSLIAATPGFTERGYMAMDDKSHSEYIDDQVVVISGATRGIGLAIACEYARLGAHLVLIGRDGDRLDQAMQRIRDFAGSASTSIEGHVADLLDVGQTETVARRIAAAHPRIAVLVNNAGALFDAHALTDDGFERSVAIHLVAPFVLTESLMAPLSAARGRVINMSSGGMYLQALHLDDMNFEQETYSGTKAYARAKRGLVALTRHWARRYDETGVRFNAMHPGWVATAGVSDAMPGFEKVMKHLLRDPRMGADTAVWLGASTTAARCNGEFFLDRRPHPTAVLPNTAVKPSAAQALYAWLRNETGVAVHGVG
ncbi:SDR family NAD(P)-dependent oxidoreductase [Salinisphaera aquimarina]|uniref:SDR family NAD(P)-dependent oxidoreductase n=1 Tax=Salinisphaera aquimarina TaxID=2094031 RepID=A0ABV7ESV8_9GAMM